MSDRVPSPSRYRPSRQASGKPSLDSILDQLRRADTELRQPLVDRQTVYTGRYLTLERDAVRTATADRAQRDIVVHPGAVVVAPVDAEGSLIMVVQYRVAVGAALLELPAGTLDSHAGVVEDELVAAHRELEEETGLRAGSMERLGGFWSAPGYSTEYLTVFLATDLTAAGEDRLSPDEDEDLRLIRLPFDQAMAAVDAGLIEDAKTIAGLLLMVNRSRAGA